MLKINILHPFCVYTNVICVCADESRKNEEKCRDVSSGDVVARHPAATFYKSRSPGMFNLSEILREKPAAASICQDPRDETTMTSRTAERLFSSIKAALFPTRIVNLSFITERLRYTRVPV